MSNLIRKILNQTKDITNWKFLIKNNFNLANVMGNSLDLKLEELRLERSQLEARAKTLMQKQRSAESMLTDLTRNIKQMEFDIVQMEKEKTQMIAPEEAESQQASNSQQKG
ncbi:uncharacterized protein LOC117785820 [Drosophila innubila]|uniref:uncharacterized protein LOC117785820 n=1 Tax=Drosophila innubila TaxID=198719 RepID=UPI00148E0146|nr:uncharacterized protein LOC117785820 [Drosophila innubila]